MTAINIDDDHKAIVKGAVSQLRSIPAYGFYVGGVHEDQVREAAPTSNHYRVIITIEM